MAQSLNSNLEEKRERDLAAWNEALMLVTSLAPGAMAASRASVTRVKQALLQAREEVRSAAIQLICENCLHYSNGAGFSELLDSLLKMHPDLTPVFCESLAGGLAVSPYDRCYWEPGLAALEQYVSSGGTLTDALRTNLTKMRAQLARTREMPHRERIVQIGRLLGEESSVAGPDPGETWADAALRDLSAMAPDQRTAWQSLLETAGSVSSGNPTRSWQKSAAAARHTVGEAEFYQCACAWFAQVTVPPVTCWYDGMHFGASDHNVTLLKGLAWMCMSATEPRVARALADLAAGALKKEPGYGPWAARAANAAISVLGAMECEEAIPQLLRLAQKMTHRPSVAVIDKAVQTAAERLGVTRADLEEMSVPTYGFDIDGVRCDLFGDCYVVARLTPSGSIEAEWFGANGKPVKSVPAAVKRDHAEALKAFKADMSAAVKMLSVHKSRFDLYTQPERLWSLGNWRKRFAEHPLLSRITNRLIWRVQAGNAVAAGVWNGQEFQDAHGIPIDTALPGAAVSLWHPLHGTPEEVAAWREYLQSHAIVQPFKQAHREVYVLTEAERRTRTYSNRFAGHILKQHQMHSLAGPRGWTAQLQLMVTELGSVPTKEIPGMDLRAQFWVEGAGDEISDAGVYLYVATDQVRFYRTAGNHTDTGRARRGAAAWPVRYLTFEEEAPLDEIPPIVFSEIMRDVDLFVSVCSVGNDPNWEDGGPEGRYRDYWHDYGFGALTQTAKTRREVLEKLVPRLKIASRCSFTERFLVVRGDIRTYKIHLGSGNILMEPNDQYLCIVESRGQAPQESVGFLPFEGDNRLSLILSKAFMLAEDRKITDRTILLQIGM